jgi:CRISPR/Cas system-associated exonuclease Cas4 (RecB family)
MKYPVNPKKLYTFSYLFLIQKVGNVIHDIIQELYNFSETEKTVVSERFKVKGRVDGIRDSFLFEIKSIDFEKFKNQYIKEHYLQAIIYAYILNKEYNYKIKTITIIYVIRNLKKIVPFDLPLNDKLAESVLNKAPILKSALESLQVPEPFGSKKETCTFCLYRKQCEDDKCELMIQPFKKKKKSKKVDTPKPPIPKKKDDKQTAFLL